MRRVCQPGSTNCIDVCLAGRSVACGTEAPGVAPPLKYNWDRHGAVTDASFIWPIKRIGCKQLGRLGRSE
jgi:hypothetical protein